MVIHPKRHRLGPHGFLTLELVVACGILAAALLPITFGFLVESRAMRKTYGDAVILELVDGEMEILAAGAWLAIPEGEKPYLVRSEALKQLPPGSFWTSKTPGRLRLEWRPAPGGRQRLQSREVRLP